MPVVFTQAAGRSTGLNCGTIGQLPSRPDAGHINSGRSRPGDVESVCVETRCDQFSKRPLQSAEVPLSCGIAGRTRPQTLGPSSRKRIRNYRLARLREALGVSRTGLASHKTITPAHTIAATAHPKVGTSRSGLTTSATSPETPRIRPIGNRTIGLLWPVNTSRSDLRGRRVSAANIIPTSLRVVRSLTSTVNGRPFAAARLGETHQEEYPSAVSRERNGSRLSVVVR